MTVQPHVVDNSQSHKHSPSDIVQLCPIWLVRRVGGFNPLVEDEHTLDIPLADTAARENLCLRLA